ncbi:venom acid phosphatase Acph-1-like isoform X2 [Cephus cinctus]|uniref:acid phosphatase n=1 Tax=Cephus cinctus TaxID=211228 RepID=A0AAJ7FFL6_CEPCN|nr:venom acid phosphatase Acph-1-like isoform X2 [Cephus cinctus]
MNAQGMQILNIVLLIGVCNADLKLLQVTFRHGDRTTVAESQVYYPNDPYINKTYWPEGYGGLINQGKDRAYRLGLFLKKNYGAWLGSVYADSLFYFRSSDISRTKMTAELVAAALFPPIDIQRWNQKLNWQPIPIWNVPLIQDILFLGQFLCEKVAILRKEIETSDPYLLKRQKELAGFFEYVSEHVGINVTQQTSYYIYMHLYSQYTMGYRMPEWTKDIFPFGQFEDVAGYDYVIQSYTKEMQKYNGGVWIREWLRNVDNYINGTATYRALFYSGHEINIAGILNSLNVFIPHVPEFASSVILELHKYGEEYFVRALHKNLDTAVELKIPGCNGIYCHLDTFRNLFADIILENPLESCRKM